MSQNNSMSFQSSNEFMPPGQSSQGPSFDQFMKVCFNNPSFFESMKHFYVNQQPQREQADIVNPNQSGFSVSNSQSLEAIQFNLNQPKKMPYRGQDQCEEYEGEVRQIQEAKRKPANPLAKFIPAESSPFQKPNQPYSKPSQPLRGPSSQDRPIKSSNAALLEGNSSDAFNLNAIKENKSINMEGVPSKKIINYDDLPINGVKEHQIDSYYKEQQKEKVNPSSTYDMDQRPLTGCANKDFKELIKEKFPNALVAEEEEHEHQNQRHEERTGHRNFLKRGSRQHLSSAITKSKQPKNKDASMSKIQLQDGNRSITPRRNLPEGRSTSQNRVLGKKSHNLVSEKALPKATIFKDDQSFEEEVSSKARPPLSKTVRAEPKSVKVADRMLNTSQIASKKKKTKNVFNDDSSESSEEEEAPYFKAVDKKKKTIQVQKKIQRPDQNDEIEVIDGVYLTQSQLEEILDKYGRVKEVVKEVVKETESEKLSALRKKYNQMIALLEDEKEQNALALQREKQDFQRFKAEQMNKIKNERRVMERQVKSGLGGGPSLQKEKEELQQIKQDLLKEREDFKRKDKNSKIILQKYKKENDELKSRLERIEIQRETRSITSKRSTGNIKNEEDDKVSVAKSISGANKIKKAVEQQIKPEEISYKDLKKGKVLDPKQSKQKFQYIDQDSRAKNKSISIKNEGNKGQNKWVSQKFDSSSDEMESDSEKDEEVNQESSLRMAEWSPAMKLSDLSKMKLSIKMVTDNMINSLFKHENNLEFVKYQQSLKSTTRTVVNTTRNARNDYTAKLYSDRSKELIYDNGTKKVSFQNGYSMVYFKNGDIKQTLPDKTVFYYFKEKEVDQITLSNGVNIYRFQNNQVEFHFENGYIEIRHPDGTIKVLGGQHMRK